MPLIEDCHVISGQAHLPARINELLESAPITRAVVLRERLNVEFPVLSDRLSRLYGGNKNFSDWLNQLVIQSLHLALARPDDLWALDTQRASQPNWHLQGSLGYCAYTDKFAGNLSGVRQRISHLQELGVTYLHLLPFLKPGTPPNDGGFAVASYDEVDPALGNNQDLQTLTKELRAAGISLCSDFVLNHVSHEHKWALKARAGDAHYQSYFHWAKTSEEVAEQEKNLIQIFPNTAPGNFTFIPEVKAWAWTTFYPYQWDLNYTQPDVFAEMSQSLLQLANLGVEAFRLDSTGFLWKRAGTNCMNQPEVHWILQALRCITNIAAPGVLLKAEAIMPTQDLPPYFGLGDTKGAECHVAYHSSLMSASWVALAEENTQIIQDVLSHTPTLPDGCAWMTYVRCHDDIGWNVLRPEMDARGADQRARLLHASQFFAGKVSGSYAQGAAFQASDPTVVHGTNGMAAALVGLTSAQTPAEQAAAKSRLVMMQALSLFVGGLPLIYMGDEWGQGNTSAQEIAQRQGPDGRELHRPMFDEHGFANRHDASKIQGQIYAALRAFIQAKKQNSSLSATHPLSVFNTGTSTVLGLKRGGNVLGLFNFSGQPQTLSPKPAITQNCMTHGTDLISGKAIDLQGLQLAPYSAIWLKK
ncbi:alpha-amylase family glycosyl hydrolase [Limnohabitans sp.]|uniref:alpha-amylase family glycosyl hydrolase n=1 Tax=Limnohabitans sp. TaxID=1907725 RepID=UPI00286FAD25|nr:alpha-amylase family glycosyl hydrolase [Limnohabitans sp.]